MTLQEAITEAAKDSARVGANELALALLAEVGKAQRGTAQELRTVSQMAAECPAFSVPALRMMVKRAEVNGLDRAGAIVRRPDTNAPLFHLARFSKWLEGGRQR